MLKGMGTKVVRRIGEKDMELDRGKECEGG